MKLIFSKIKTVKIYVSKSTTGFTLIEAVLYLAIAGTILYFISSFAFNVIFSKSKIETIQDINQNSQAVINKISTTVEDAIGINGITQ